MLVAIFSNYSEIIALHKIGKECVWLMSVIGHTQNTCGLNPTFNVSAIFCEYNIASIKQIKKGYIKSDRTKHISPNFFYTHELQNSGQVNICQIQSSKNLADLFTKFLPTSTYEDLVYNLGTRRTHEDQSK